MGVLEEAIREHLELRRLRGADPSELARDEQAALGQLTGDAADEQAVDPWSGPGDAMALGDAHARGDGRAPTSDDALLYASEETAEIDMSEILGFGLDGARAGQTDRARGGTAAPAPSAIGRAAPNLETELDRLDWEVSRTRTAAGRARHGSDLKP